MTSQSMQSGANGRMRLVAGRADSAGASDQLADLPPVIDLLEAAEILGVGRTTAYKLVRSGEWPTPLIRVGRLIKVPTAPLRELLGC